MAAQESLEMDDGSVKGELVEFVARYDDGTSATTYFLRVNGNERDQRELVLDKRPEFGPMTRVKVWGVERDRRIVVNKMEVAEEPSRGAGVFGQPLINPVPLPATKLAMAVVDIGTGTNITPDELNKRLYTNANSTKAYYLENSFGMHDLVGMVSPKTYSYPMTTCDTSGMASALRAQLDTDVGQVSDVYLWYIGKNTTACSWSGLSGGKDTWYNGSSSCVVLVQEPGHSFGMSHSSSMTCTDPTTGAVTAIRDDLGAGDATTCTHSEYGNRYDTMGGGCRHFNAYNKVYRTYLQKCNGVNVRKSGTFNLMPIEKPCNGIQALQVPMPRTRGFFRTGGGGSAGVTQLSYYTVELRSPIGFDTGMKPTVIINASPKWSVISTTGGRGSRGEHTWLLDMAPTVTSGSDGTAHALAAGQTFTDPAGGVSITTLSVGNEGAVIKVDITGTTSVADAGTQTVCLDGTPFDGEGPPTCGDDGGGPPPPIDVGTPPPVDASTDVRVDSTGAGGTAGATGAGGSAGKGGATTGTGGAAGTTTTTTTTGVGGAMAGSGGTGTGGTATGGSGGAAGSDTGGNGGSRPPPPGDPGGCGCRVVASEEAGARTGGLVGLGLALAALARRRSRRSPT
jgi:hypothetical protein